MLRRWIPGLIAVAVVLLATESVFAQRILDRLRSRREGRQDNTVQTVQSQPQQQANVQQPQQQPQTQPATTNNNTTYYETGRFGLLRRRTPVTMTSTTTSQPQASTVQPATSNDNMVTYERRGLFGRRMVPVQTVAYTTSNVSQPTTQPASNGEIVTYERRGLFGRRSVPVVQTVASTNNSQAQPQPQGQQPQPVAGTNTQPAGTTVSQGTTNYYNERRGLFGRRRGTPVQGTASTTINNDPATPRRAFYLEPGSASVLLNVKVPANAEVLVDGQRTSRTGTERQFISPPLAPGFEYTYTVEARWQENGQPVTKTRKVTVQPGKEAMVDFNQAQ